MFGIKKQCFDSEPPTFSQFFFGENIFKKSTPAVDVMITIFCPML
jgi:hypothetical protein